MAAAWLVRAGRAGERDAHNLADSVVGGGFTEVGDLSSVSSKSEMQAIVKAAYPGASSGKVGNFTGQLWAFRCRMDIGDYVVLPLKTTSQLAIGRVVGPYEYRGDQPEDRRHTRRVDWIRTDVARTAVHQDLLHSLGAFMTVCQLTRNDAARRIEKLAETGSDPGARTVTSGAGDEDGAVTDESASDILDVEQYARDRLATLVAERFAGHKLARLVAAVLTAEGFVCEVSDEGPDGGIDILAGRGPLGLDSPRLAVQVKSSPTPVDAPTVRQLHGVITTHGADQGLLIAWGGVNNVARRELANQRFTVRVWDAAKFLDAFVRVYDRLPEDTRAELPLKLVWVPVEDTPGG